MSRSRRPPLADERTTVTAFLRWHRETLTLKCSGLASDQLAARSVEPSGLSLLGLLEMAADLDVTGDEPGEGPVSLRWVLLHMIEEYARHNGHADLLREQVDGTTGL